MTRASESRYRARSAERSGGVIYPNSSPDPRDTRYTWLSESCSDWVGGGDCDPFYVSRFRKEGGAITRATENPNGVVFQGYVADKQRSSDPGFHGHYSLPFKSNGVYATKLQALTNPSRPHVDLGQFVAELRDIPGLMKTVGSKWYAFLGKNNLRYHFGIAPVVSDLVQMLDFQNQVNSRNRELHDLFTRGLRRTKKLDHVSQTGSKYDLVQSYGLTASVYMSWITRANVTGHIRWVPTTPIMPDESKMLALANRGVKGLTFDFKTAWELLPWSWMADWFANTGDYLAAHRNIVGHRVEELVLMTHTLTEGGCPPVSWNTALGPASISGIRNVYETKQRVRATATLTATEPFLNGYRAGILASLVATGRRLRRSLG